MSNLNDKKKSIIIGSLCVTLVIAIGITITLLVNSLKGTNALENKKEKENKVYATIKEVGPNFIRVNSLNSDEEMLINTDKKLNEGDFVVITYNADEELSITPNSIEVIATNKEVLVVTTTTSNIKATSTTTTSKSISTTTRNNVPFQNEVNDEAIIAFAKSSYDEVSTEKNASITSSIKSNFITLVDFLFYDGTIKGKKFRNMTDKAKAKVIYYTLLMDNKIDSLWPNYKTTIKDKANNLKEKLIAKYMDITTNLCENHEDGCKIVKEDFALLKSSLNLTWDIIKSAFLYGYNKSYTYLKNWYEVWRERE